MGRKLKAKVLNNAVTMYPNSNMVYRVKFFEKVPTDGHPFYQFEWDLCPEWGWNMEKFEEETEESSKPIYE
jgi:hypothetical protein